uniref:Uncharacterized protein n=1 Tax=Arundo donax TaxID=35708 RepID=A0A0A9FY63_ARUDO
MDKHKLNSHKRKANNPNCCTLEFRIQRQTHHCLLLQGS